MMETEYMIVILNIIFSKVTAYIYILKNVSTHIYWLKFLNFVVSQSNTKEK